MKKIILICLVCLLVGCQLKTETKENNQGKITKELNDDSQIIEMYGCEYLEIVTYRATYILHKGNCKYCTERLKQMLSK